MKKLLFLTLFLPFVYTAFCQYPEIHFERIPDLQNDHCIKCLLQDHKGFMWFGGENGLYRYDGYNVSYYKDPPGCKNCPPFYPVYDIVEDDHGMLWTISFKGITLYDPETEKSCVAYRFKSASVTGSSFSYLKYLDLMKDSHGNIWATNDMGLIRFSYKGNGKGNEINCNKSPECFLNTDFFILYQDTISAQNLALKIYEDAEGNIWTGCMDGLYVMRKGDSSFYRFEIEAEKKIASRTKIVDILQQNKDTFWILPRTQDYLYLMTNVKKALPGSVPNGSALCFTKFVTAMNQPNYRLYKDRKNNIFIGNNLDVIKFKGSNEKAGLTFESLYKNILAKKDYITDKFISGILEDQSGMMWIGHEAFGIMKLNPDRSPFDSYNNLALNTFSSLNITAIHLDNKGILWTGTWGGGLYRIDKEHKLVTGYNLGFDGNDIICMEEINPGIFWMGTNAGLLEFNTLTGKLHSALSTGRITDDIKNLFVTGILKDQNQLYLTSSDGIFVYDLTRKSLVKFSYPNNDSILYLNNWMVSPIKLTDGEIIAVSTYYGLLKINYDAEKGCLSVHSLVSDSALRSRNINLTHKCMLFQDSRGFLWMVEKNGLHRINIQERKIYDYNLNNNTSFPEALSIIEDCHDNLWIGTGSGLCKFDMITGEVKKFTTEDGVPISIHQAGSVCKDKDGWLYFGGVEGFYCFHPDSIKTNTVVPPVVITDFRLFKKSVSVDTVEDAILKKNISYTGKIELHHDQKDLSIEFAALDYTLPLRNQYAYKLEGYQNNWIETDAKNRVATYTNLDPGTYIFRVKGSNNDGFWNEEGTSLTIIIHKPWWGTTLSWCIYVLAFLCATAGYIRWRLWRLKKEKLQLERQIHERTQQVEEQKDLLELQNQQITEHEQLKSRFFTNVSHEFRTPLSLIQSPVEELLDDPRLKEKERNKLNMIRRNAHRLLNLVNQLLDISKIDGSKMKLELVPDDVMKHLRAIAGAFMSLSETKRISYQLHFPVEETISWFDPDKLEKIAGNLLSNAFKFTPEGGEIIFTALYRNNIDHHTDYILEFSVKDNGNGIPSESLEKIFDRFYQVEESLKTEGGGTGIGLSLARDMARLMHGDITVQSEPGAGSTFTVTLRLGKDHLKESEFILLKEAPESVPFIPESHDDPGKIISHKEAIIKNKNPTLLIVEDNRDIRMQLADNFSRDYFILEAIDGEAGLKKATEMIPDLVITDLMMPRMNGVELCEKLKKDERTSHIPVVMLTAKVTLEDKITGLMTGADDYVPKPFRMAELKARVANLIEQRRKLRKRFSREVTLMPGDISITPLDEIFLNRAVAIVEKHMHDDTFNLQKFREEINMSGSTLFRKLHALTDQSPTEFIRTIRLKRSASMLEQNFGNVSQVSYEVGFNNLSYFNKSFKKLYGISPLEYLKMHRFEKGVESLK